MSGQILVPLKNDEPIEEIIPYLEEITRPGIRVVFLVHFPVDGFAWLRDQLAVMQTAMQTILGDRSLAYGSSWEGQKQFAERKVFPARKALEGRGVEVAVELHTDSLKKVVRRYTTNRDVHLIVMRAGNRLRGSRSIQRRTSFFGFSKRYSHSSVLVLRPDHSV